MKRLNIYRWMIFTMGLMVMALGFAFMIRAELGSAPWDVLHIGLTLHFGLTVGTWSILIGFLVLMLTFFLTREWPKLGAFLNMIFLGVFIDIFLWMMPTPDSLMGRWTFLIIGILVIGYGIGLYIAPKCGAGPRDILMLALTKRTGWKVQWVRSMMEVLVLLIGWYLGGPIFIGTLMFCFGIGTVVGFSIPHCQRLVDFILERREIYENLNKGSIRVNDYDGISKKSR
ncbi:YczE/YyaS/YitT family protein [Bacillus solitudinis]|uniref:YczE/YyaS/YitT family protein n=1 Tax=Bacillus solitudinis TaxID=2014074 RepID=UPI000C23BB75|nr:YitT family protein [Bacillus solitudinis]